MDASTVANAESWLSVIGTAKLVAAFLVAAGVAVEFLGDWFSTPFERVVADARTIELQQLRTAAAQAEAHAADAQLALEKFKAPRVLGFDKAKQDRVIEQLRPFSGMKFDAGVVIGDVEGGILLSVLEDILKRAGLVQIDWKDKNPGALLNRRPGSPIVGSIEYAGVIVEIDVAKSPNLMPAAVAIAKALGDEGIPAAADGHVIANTTNADTIHLLVGKKM